MIYSKVAETQWQIMFKMISVYYSAEKHLLFKVSWNSVIKVFDSVNYIFNHQIFSHHTSYYKN